MSLYVLPPITLAAAVADDGTITLAYPAGTAQADFVGANAAADGVVTFNGNDVLEQGASTFSLTYGASDITLTNLSGASWAAGSVLRVQLGQAGNNRPGFQPGDPIANLTDSSGGTAGATLPAIGGSYVQADIRNSVATLNAQMNRILIALRSAGVIS